MSYLSAGSSNSFSSVVVPTVCVGAAVCVVAYVVWGPDYFLKKRGLCSGLVNLGNTCFINTVLQSLATLPGVDRWLEENVAHHKGGLGIALRDILKALNENQSGGTCSPVEVLRALTKHRWKIDYQHQDAHELYHVLLNTLEEEQISCPSLSDIIELQQSQDMGSKVWTRSGSVTTPTKPISCPLRGMLTSNLHCMRCNLSLPVKYECFDSISLTLPQYKCTLENCLLEFFKSEVVYDVECLHCSENLGVPVKQTFLKKLQLGRAPACLCIHFNRTQWASAGFLHKSSLHVTFPISLDASKLLKQEEHSAGVRYLLHAVVQHNGGPSFGHYLTYRRCGAHSNKWVYASDTTVYWASMKEVLKAEAYMLFYCRTKLTNS